MINNNDGAFSSHREYGLTKREYMAIHFMAAMLANPNTSQEQDISLARYARISADLLCKELNKETTPCK